MRDLTDQKISQTAVRCFGGSGFSMGESARDRCPVSKKTDEASLTEKPASLSLEDEKRLSEAIQKAKWLAAFGVGASCQRELHDLIAFGKVGELGHQRFVTFGLDLEFVAWSHANFEV